jgi:uncharacterized protein with FMN-binding domain
LDKNNEGQDSPAQQDLACDGRYLRRCGHGRMRDDGHRRHQSLVRPQQQRRHVGFAHSRRSNYADGTYTATGQYGSLPSSIGVSVTLVDDVITAVTVTPHATDPTSLDYQTRFAQAVPALVVGRNIDEVNLSKVAGSSGTPDGFNAAIQQIKAEATN